MQPAIRERLEKCSNLPSLPAVALQVLKLCQGEDLDLGQIAKVITNDPALSAKMLRLVNSPSYGLRQQVKTISHALALLGVNAVRTLALSFSLASDLRRKSQPGLDLTAYWKRSALSAVAGRELAAANKMAAIKEEAFLAALLQDIGRLALARVAPDLYGPLSQRAGGDHVVLEMLERGELGADHAEVGQWLTTTWNLPAPAVRLRSRTATACRCPERDRYRIAKLARVVAVSGLLADIWVREDAQEATLTAREQARALLGMNPPQLDPVLNSIAGSMAEVSSLFEIDLGTADEINPVLDEAQETLMMVTLGNSRQAASAQQALQTMEAKTARARGGVAARSADRAQQPRAARQLHRRRGAERRAHRQAAVADHRRRRSLQEGQRHLRPPRGRRGADRRRQLPERPSCGRATWWRATAARSSCWCCPRPTPTGRWWSPSACAR